MEKDLHKKLFENPEMYEDQIAELIEEWHEGDSPLQLHEYLGLSWTEYQAIFSN